MTGVQNHPTPGGGRRNHRDTHRERTPTFCSQCWVLTDLDLTSTSTHSPRRIYSESTRKEGYLTSPTPLFLRREILPTVKKEDVSDLFE